MLLKHPTEDRSKPAAPAKPPPADTANISFHSSWSSRSVGSGVADADDQEGASKVQPLADLQFLMSSNPTIFPIFTFHLNVSCVSEVKADPEKL